jgi:hypothetical protein
MYTTTDKEVAHKILSTPVIEGEYWAHNAREAIKEYINVSALALALTTFMSWTNDTIDLCNAIIQDNSDSK